MTGKRIAKTSKGHPRVAQPQRPLPESGTEETTETQALNHEQEKLVRWFQTVKFRKKLIGGVDEAQLWKKLEELNQLYEAAISAERVRYDALIHDHTKTCNTLSRKYQQELSKRDSSGPDTTRTDSEAKPKSEVWR